jgi:hypothetical protein
VQDEQQIKNLVFKTYPLLKNAKVLEWGYKTLVSYFPLLPSPPAPVSSPSAVPPSKS